MNSIDQKKNSSLRSNHQKQSWICQSEKTLITSPVLDVVEQKCISSEDKRPYTFYVLKSHDWCNIIPVTEEGKIVLVKQYRIGIAEHTFEAPGGVIDPSDPDIQAAALRELQEETGYIPLDHARVQSLGWAYPNPAMQNNQCFSFIVGPVRKSQNQNLDPGEMIEVIEVPLEEMASWIRDGKINHALILNAFLQLLLQEPITHSLLERQLKNFSQSREIKSST